MFAIFFLKTARFVDFIKEKTTGKQCGNRIRQWANNSPGFL